MMQAGRPSGGPTAVDPTTIAGWQLTNELLNDQDCAEALGGVNGEDAKMRLRMVNITQQTTGFPGFGPATANPIPAPPGAPAGSCFDISWTGARTNGTSIVLNTPVFFGATNVVGTTGKDLLFWVGQQFTHAFTVEQFQALILLHELGHVLSGLPGDLFPNGTGNLIQSNANSEKVIEKCFKWH
jgi:hypothetical protein